MLTRRVVCINLSPSTLVFACNAEKTYVEHSVRSSSQSDYQRNLDQGSHSSYDSYHDESHSQSSHKSTSQKSSLARNNLNTSNARSGSNRQYSNDSNSSSHSTNAKVGFGPFSASASHSGSKSSQSINSSGNTFANNNTFGRGSVYQNQSSNTSESNNSSSRISKSAHSRSNSHKNEDERKHQRSDHEELSTVHYKLESGYAIVRPGQCMPQYVQIKAHGAPVFVTILNLDPNKGESPELCKNFTTICEFMVVRKYKSGRFLSKPLLMIEPTDIEPDDIDDYKLNNGDKNNLFKSVILGRAEDRKCLLKMMGIGDCFKWKLVFNGRKDLMYQSDILERTLNKGKPPYCFIFHTEKNDIFAVVVKCKLVKCRSVKNGCEFDDTSPLYGLQQPPKTKRVIQNAPDAFSQRMQPHQDLFSLIAHECKHDNYTLGGGSDLERIWMGVTHSFEYYLLKCENQGFYYPMKHSYMSEYADNQDYGRFLMVFEKYTTLNSKQYQLRVYFNTWERPSAKIVQYEVFSLSNM